MLFLFEPFWMKVFLKCLFSFFLKQYLRILESVFVISGCLVDKIPV